MMNFVSVALRNYKQVGAVCPSGPALSKALARAVRTAKGPKRVLEAGPGTGPVTKFILDALRPGDHLDVVELSPEFSAALTRNLLDPFAKANPKIEIAMHTMAIQDAPLPNGAFDFIVCGLPFNNFPAPVVRQIMDRFMALLKPNGELSYFGYTGMRPIKASISSAAERHNLRALGTLERELMSRHGGHRQIVLANIPPASVLRLRKS